MQLKQSEGSIKLKEHQPPVDVDRQIENLKQVGLVVSDETYARRILNDISYFRLIKGYGLGLKPKNGCFDGKVSFEQIVDLYLFNANFRQLLFSMIEKIEVNLRCRLSNYFSNKYGVFGYETPENFVDADKHESFMAEIKNELSRNGRSPFIKNYLDNYEGKKVPFYALIEIFSFGTLSKFYKNLYSGDKKAIAQTYGVSYTYLESWIEHISMVRNICAHYGRLYNVSITKTPKLYKQYSKLKISNQRVFATLLCIKHLVPNDSHWVEFVDTIGALFEKYSSVDPKLMAFPKTWKTVLMTDCGA